VLSKYKEALSKSDNAVRKQQLAGMHFYKAPPAPRASPTSSSSTRSSRARNTTSPRIITEVFPTEVQALYQKYKDSFAGRGIPR
jgi:hypothetical protein